MIAGGLEYVWAAYAVALVALAGLAGVVAVRLRHWANRARDLDRKSP